LIPKNTENEGEFFGIEINVVEDAKRVGLKTLKMIIKKTYERGQRSCERLRK